MNLSSLKSTANGSASIFEIDIPPEKVFEASKLFGSKLVASSPPLVCFLFRILSNITTTRIATTTAAAAEHADAIIVELLPLDAEPLGQTVKTLMK